MARRTTEQARLAARYAADREVLDHARGTVRRFEEDDARREAFFADLARRRRQQAEATVHTAAARRHALEAALDPSDQLVQRPRRHPLPRSPPSNSSSPARRCFARARTRASGPSGTPWASALRATSASRSSTTPKASAPTPRTSPAAATRGSTTPSWPPGSPRRLPRAASRRADGTQNRPAGDESARPGLHAGESTEPGDASRPSGPRSQPPAGQTPAGFFSAEELLLPAQRAELPAPPLAVLFPFAARSKGRALAVLALAGLTDVLDGWLARQQPGR